MYLKFQSPLLPVGTVMTDFVIISKQDQNQKGQGYLANFLHSVIFLLFQHYQNTH